MLTHVKDEFVEIFPQRHLMHIMTGVCVLHRHVEKISLGTGVPTLRWEDVRFIHYCMESLLSLQDAQIYLIRIPMKGFWHCARHSG